MRLLHAVDDDAARLEKAVTIARGRAELLVFTGGLGPTYDDMTKTAVCAALDTPLVYHPEVVEDMRRYFDRVFRREMPECDMQQAYLPEGCTVFRNPVGTAPGCVFTAGKTTAALLPGVPHECSYMAEHCLLPWLEQVRGQTVRSHTLHIFGLTEPQVQELLGDLLRREADMTLAPYAKPGEVMLQLSARGADERACEARMAPVLAEVRARLGAYLYGADVSGLEETVLTLCRERGLTLAAAESCTGGLIAKRLTDIPGASQVFLGGVVSYTNHVKQQVLHVPENLLARCGAVSAEVARAMALGVRVLTGADLAVSVTGLAGPDGDDRGNPVGTVFVGLSTPEGVTVRHLLCHTSGLRDLPMLDDCLKEGKPYTELLRQPEIRACAPGQQLIYSNFGFGLLGCILEQQTGLCIEPLFQEMLFRPLHMRATLDASTLNEAEIMPITRVLPYRAGQELRVTALGRHPLQKPNPLCHYGHTAGAMYTDGRSVLQMLTLIYQRGTMDETRLIGENLMQEMTRRQSATPTRTYGLGLVILNRPEISPRQLLGHQGFAYGCVDGAFIEEETGRAVVFLNGGASEARTGRLGLVNRDVLQWALKQEMPSWT